MTTETIEQVPEPTADPATLALLRNDLRGLSKDQIGALVAALTERMGVDPALAPIDLIRDSDGAIRPYVNARGAAEIAKRALVSDDELTIEVRERPAVVIAQLRQRAEDGRTVRDVGASAYDPERPLTLARAIKTASTSAHRRTTLRLVGIFLPEPLTGGPLDADA